MKLFVLACVLLGTGCLWANEKSESLVGYGGNVILDDGGQLEGAAAHLTGGYAGLTADGEVNLRHVTRPDQPDTYRAAGFGFAVRASLLGIIATDHRLERYFDLGADTGFGLGGAFGVPPHDIDGTASVWYGAWTELGTISAGSGYLAVIGGLRRELFDGPYDDQTQLMIGIAWRKRARVEPGSFHD